MSNELDQALLSGNVDDLDALINSFEIDEIDLMGGDDEPRTESDIEDSEQKAVADEDAVLPELIDNTKPVETAEPAQGDGNPKTDGHASDGYKEIDGKLYLEVDPANAEILGKDGKHSIPYTVLEHSRQDSARTRAEAQQLRDELNKVRPQAQKVELLARQLEEAGITPDKLPDELLNDPQALEAIQRELGGTAGQLIAALVQRVQTQQPQTSQPNEVHPVDAALNRDELKALHSWQDNDPDRWSVAIAIDNQLKTDPEFNALPLADRFIEVQRRVMATFGDPVQASIDAQKQADKPAQGQSGDIQEQQAAAVRQTQIPNSPSRLGGSSTDTRDGAHQALAAQDPLALEKALEGMNPSDVEEFLAEAAMML